MSKTCKNLKSNYGFTIPCRRDSKLENRSPGPAQYDTSKFFSYMKTSTGYTMNGRAKVIEKGVVSPGPKYLPKVTVKGGKGYSFGVRTTNGPYFVPEDRRDC